MNQILGILAGHDLRSDGKSNEVASLVLENPLFLDDLLVGINSKNDVIRARTMDALEKISREKPELVQNQFNRLCMLASSDEVAMVKMHLAMILGHLLVCNLDITNIKDTLLTLLEDSSVFTKSWAIVSLCILCRKFPGHTPEILDQLEPLLNDSSIAIRTKVKKALSLLLNEDLAFPVGWVKSVHL